MWFAARGGLRRARKLPRAKRGCRVKRPLCAAGPFRYGAGVKTVINIEEKIGKTVGRRVAPRDPFSLAGDTKADKRAWQKAFPTPFIPKGVYRFHTHEEADAWLMKMMTRPKVRTLAN